MKKIILALIVVMLLAGCTNLSINPENLLTSFVIEDHKKLILYTNGTGCVALQETATSFFEWEQINYKHYELKMVYSTYDWEPGTLFTVKVKGFEATVFDSDGNCVDL